ncbi:MAG: hypothetical protein GTO45_18240 [Candidatus Aminicenantes bacterium]|nr:hypothetical protein [Candidatus Aminicenantes bacterium]NIM80728.1 hypothetical protein [Candidatus Aminicenantes bacterium]NIN20103.1 hypothetical protein [Candidatus Aminicenantes bacterium]NIN43890.1 hypothetical protein [Candidatus Aminicenantes bacterium]NIN86699.1 hypothetical protein [Candidatus Aminicenantes bacterium]
MVKRIIYIAIGAILVFCVIYFGFIKGVFTPSGLSVEETSITIEKIADIKELTAAEYYGEVVYSLREYYREELGKKVKKLYDRLKDAEKKGLLAQNDLRNERILTEKLAVIITDQEEKEAIDTLRRLYTEVEYDANNRRYTIVITNAGLLQLFLESSRWEDFKKKYSAKVEKEITKMKTDIAYLARGWVKAVYDLSRLAADKDAHFFCEGTGTLFLNLEMKIKSEINPWFIFDKKVKIEGYTILKEKKVNLNNPESYRNILIVKKGCKERLVRDAKNADIEKIAKVSAEESLGNFLLLFLYKDKEIKSVKIIEDSQAFKAEKEKCLQENKESS